MMQTLAHLSTMWPRGAIYGQMYQGGDAVSKTVCGGFDSQLSVPEAG